MPSKVVIVGENETLIWALNSSQRIKRQIQACGMVASVSDDDFAEAEQTLVLNSNYVFETLTIEGFAARPDTVLRADDGGIAAIRCTGMFVEQGLEAMRGNRALPEHLKTIRAQELAGYNSRLRKTQPPLLETVRADNADALESLLYGNSYKGVTDLVTKWWWPRPARVITGWCARSGITPNQVTLTGFALVIAAYFLFGAGQYAAGLMCGWIMTLLDTVDGKLARVTVNSSKLGHVLDHGLDMIHPPFWYAAWGMSVLGTGGWLGFTTMDGCWLVVLGYIGGRFIEASFHSLGACGMFAWRPFDAWFRLVTARRNPCLIILTTLLIVTGPTAAFWGVVVWTVLSTFIMLLRLMYATFVRLRSGPLDSWLKDSARAAREHPRSYAEFSGTRGAFR